MVQVVAVCVVREVAQRYSGTGILAELLREFGCFVGELKVGLVLRNQSDQEV